MSQRRASNVNRCSNCRINKVLCVCEHIKPFKVNTKVSMVVHVRELKLTSNTAQFAEKMLPENVEIIVRGRMNDNFETTSVLPENTENTFFLYPHDDALELNDDFKAKYPGPYHLVIPDGNWQQARKVRQREAGFTELKAVKLPSGIVGEYELRKARFPEWVSTYEAMAHALGILEGDEVREQLMEFFRIWVKQTQKARSGNYSSTN